MANTSPPWITPTEFVVTVNNQPVSPEPSVERAWGGAGKYTGTDTDYQTLIACTVASDKLGELKEIIFYAADYTHVLLEIVVGEVTWATGWNPGTSEPVIFEDLRLAAGVAVTVKVKSDDGTSITVDAIIVGKELG